MIIKNPISQHINGTAGAFRIQNIEKKKTFNIAEWRDVCARPENQPPAKRGQTRKTQLATDNKNKRHLPSQCDAEVDSSEFNRERCLELERVYWKTVGYNSPMYGADMPGSLFDESTQSWNVASLDDMLSTLPVKIPGVNSAYLYCGMWKSTFAWHLEDMDLYSINYIHFGAPKCWYSISQDDKDKFFALMCDIWPEEYKNCREFLRHKTFHVSPSLLASHGIRVNRLLHYEHEFVLTFPYGYHSGFNYGYNCAESVNFAIKDWLPLGKLAKQCMCISDSVGIDVVGLFLKPPEEVKEEIAETTKEIQVVPKKRKRQPITEKEPVKEVLPPPPICALCPSKDNLSSISHKGLLVHKICALYIPEIYSEVTPSGQEILCGIENIPATRWLLTCSYCGSAHGACVQCSCNGCTRAFHPTCTFNAGVSITTEETDTNVPKLKFLCRSHQSKVLSQNTKRQNLDTSYSLLPGDMVQFQINAGRLYSGVLQKNNISEQTALIAVLPSFDDVLEVPWEKITVPGSMAGTSKKPKASIPGPASKSSTKSELFDVYKWTTHHTPVSFPRVDLSANVMFYNPTASSDALDFYDHL